MEVGRRSLPPPLTPQPRHCRRWRLRRGHVAARRGTQAEPQLEPATSAGVILPETGQFLLLYSLQLWNQLQRCRQTRARVQVFLTHFTSVRGVLASIPLGVVAQLNSPTIRHPHAFLPTPSFRYAFYLFLSLSSSSLYPCPFLILAPSPLESGHVDTTSGKIYLQKFKCSYRYIYFNVHCLC